jgi:hypothetical protein
VRQDDSAIKKSERKKGDTMFRREKEKKALGTMKEGKER